MEENTKGSKPSKPSKEITEEDLVMLMRGERPESLTYEQFRLGRKNAQRLLKEYKKGRYVKKADKKT